MPALFDVPGWSVPSDGPVSIQRQSKKRKRAASSEEQDPLRNAQANLDKLIDSLGGGTALSGGANDGSSKKKGRKKANKPISQPSHSDQHREEPRPPAKPQGQGKDAVRTAVDPPTISSKVASPKKKAKAKKPKHAVQPTKTSEQSAAVQDMANLTPLQRNLKKKLDGARFRLLNETLYKSSSLEAVKMMKEGPMVFEDYHAGFRRQVQSWPSNPVSHYISELSSYPPKTVIADLGCGDAALAKALFAKNLIVLSFDLVSDGAYVTEADICSQVPLPGSEPQSTESTYGEAQIVDVVVCALSLMSTNWLKCINEAWRILRPGGELMIAEVASRITSVHDFSSVINSIGFKFQKKDDRNSHFTLLWFNKVARPVISEQEWIEFMSHGRILKPCEYKRR